MPTAKNDEVRLGQVLGEVFKSIDLSASVRLARLGGGVVSPVSLTGLRGTVATAVVLEPTPVGGSVLALGAWSETGGGAQMSRHGAAAAGEAGATRLEGYDV